jgi:hypothetical protein
LICKKVKETEKNITILVYMVCEFTVMAIILDKYVEWGVGDMKEGGVQESLEDLKSYLAFLPNIHPNNLSC